MKLEVEQISALMEKMANEPASKEAPPSNSHWTGEYLQKKYETIKEACDYQDYLIALKKMNDNLQWAKDFMNNYERKHKCILKKT